MMPCMAFGISQLAIGNQAKCGLLSSSASFDLPCLCSHASMIDSAKAWQVSRMAPTSSSERAGSSSSLRT